MSATLSKIRKVPWSNKLFVESIWAELGVMSIHELGRSPMFRKRCTRFWTVGRIRLLGRAAMEVDSVLKISSRLGFYLEVSINHEWPREAVHIPIGLQSGMHAVQILIAATQ